MFVHVPVMQLCKDKEEKNLQKENLVTLVYLALEDTMVLIAIIPSY